MTTTHNTETHIHMHAYTRFCKFFFSGLILRVCVKRKRERDENQTTAKRQGKSCETDCEKGGKTKG